MVEHSKDYLCKVAAELSIIYHNSDVLDEDKIYFMLEL